MTARRLLLFQAAADLFTKYGYRKTSVEDITKAAGVSKGSLYLEFRSKEELFEALVRHEFGAYLEDAGERITADPEGGRLSRIYRHCIEALLHRAFLRALYTRDERILAGILRQRGPQRYRSKVLLGAQFIDRMQQAGLIQPDIAPETLSHTLSVLMVGPLLAEPVLHDDDSPALADTFAALSAMIVTAFESADGDLGQGKQAFANLKRDLDRTPTAPAPRAGVTRQQ
ncbi:MAG: helix-turn-helix domain-containing protein [Micropruina sp.]|nr:TetR/AcrR family transcriptional regulator [Micropruina sp.]